MQIGSKLLTVIIGSTILTTGINISAAAAQRPAQDSIISLSFNSKPITDLYDKHKSTIQRAVIAAGIIATLYGAWKLYRYCSDTKAYSDLLKAHGSKLVVQGYGDLTDKGIIAKFRELGFTVSDIVNLEVHDTGAHSRSDPISGYNIIITTVLNTFGIRPGKPMLQKFITYMNS